MLRALRVLGASTSFVLLLSACVSVGGSSSSPSTRSGGGSSPSGGSGGSGSGGGSADEVVVIEAGDEGNFDDLGQPSQFPGIASGLTYSNATNTASHREAPQISDENGNFHAVIDPRGDADAGIDVSAHQLRDGAFLYANDTGTIAQNGYTLYENASGNTSAATYGFLEYLMFGAFAVVDGAGTLATGSVDTVAGVFGFETDDDEVAQSFSTASYTGAMAAYGSDATGLYRLVGDATVQVNFSPDEGEDHISGEFDNISAEDMAGNASAWADNMSVLWGAVISLNSDKHQFSGGGTNALGVYDNGNLIATGSIAGRFYGATGGGGPVEMGAAWNATGDSSGYNFAGAFGAEKVIDPSSGTNVIVVQPGDEGSIAELSETSRFPGIAAKMAHDTASPFTASDRQTPRFFNDLAIMDPRGTAGGDVDLSAWDVVATYEYADETGTVAKNGYDVIQSTNGTTQAANYGFFEYFGYGAFTLADGTSTLLTGINDIAAGSWGFESSTDDLTSSFGTVKYTGVMTGFGSDATGGYNLIGTAYAKADFDAGTMIGEFNHIAATDAATGAADPWANDMEVSWSSVISTDANDHQFSGGGASGLSVYLSGVEIATGTIAGSFYGATGGGGPLEAGGAWNATSSATGFNFVGAFGSEKMVGYGGGGSFLLQTNQLRFPVVAGTGTADFTSNRLFNVSPIDTDGFDNISADPPVGDIDVYVDTVDAAFSGFVNSGTITVDGADSAIHGLPATIPAVSLDYYATGDGTGTQMATFVTGDLEYTSFGAWAVADGASITAGTARLGAAAYGFETDPDAVPSFGDIGGAHFDVYYGGGTVGWASDGNGIYGFQGEMVLGISMPSATDPDGRMGGGFYNFTATDIETGAAAPWLTDGSGNPVVVTVERGHVGPEGFASDGFLTVHYGDLWYSEDDPDTVANELNPTEGIAWGSLQGRFYGPASGEIPQIGGSWNAEGGIPGYKFIGSFGGAPVYRPPSPGEGE